MLMGTLYMQESTIEELVANLIQFAEDFTDSDRTVIKVTDSEGNYIERVKIFKQRLTDGSYVHNVELHFHK
jgi:urate oxidase